MRFLSAFVLIVIAMILALKSSLIYKPQSPPPKYRAQIFRAENAEIIPDSYRVRLKDNHTLDAHFENIGMNLTEVDAGFKIWKSFHLSKTYSIKTNSTFIFEQIVQDPGIELVSYNHIMYLPRPIRSKKPPETVEVPDGAVPPISKRTTWNLEFSTDYWWKQSFSYYNANTEYSGSAQIQAGYKLDMNAEDRPFDYPKKTQVKRIAEAGKGVDIYVLDTGIRITHEQFGGRASNFPNISSSETSPYVYEPMADYDGHGTHVAALAAGVAKAANIFNVKVLERNALGDPVGSVESLAMAVMDIVEVHQEKLSNKTPGFRGSVINMSLSGSHDTDFYRALELASRVGIHLVTTAGNDNEMTKAVAPCRYQSLTLCVAASDRNYNKASFSNYGFEVDFIAPGEDIVSAYYQNDTAVGELSGTSMATPLVTGTIAIYMGFEDIVRFSPSKGYDRLVSNKLDRIVTGFPLDYPTYNRFLNTGINNPNKPYRDPYYGIPHDELKLSELETNDTTTLLANGNSSVAKNETGFAAQEDAVAPPTAPYVELPNSVASTVTVTPSYTEAFVPEATATTAVNVDSNDVLTATTGYYSPWTTWETITTSSVTPITTLEATTTIETSPTAAAGTAYCINNQVDASCVAGTLPSATPYSGPHPPACARADGEAGSLPRINETQASTAASDYCSQLISEEVVLSEGSGDVKAYTVSGVAENGGDMTLTVPFDIDYCPQDKSNSTIDFKALGLPTCRSNFFDYFMDGCEQDSSWGDYNPEFTMEGGILGTDCGVWSLSSEA